MCIYIYIHIEREIICIFHYWSIMFLLIQVDIIYSTRGRSSILPRIDHPSRHPKMDPQETVIWAASQVERWFSGYRLSWFVPETPESFNGQLAGTRQLHDFPKGTGSSTSHLISRRAASKMVSRSVSCKIHSISIEIFYFHRNILVILVMMVLWCPQSNLQSEKTFCVGFRWWNQWWIPPQHACCKLGPPVLMT